MGDALQAGVQAHFLKTILKIQNSKYKIHIDNYLDARSPPGPLPQSTNYVMYKYKVFLN